MNNKTDAPLRITLTMKGELINKVHAIKQIRGATGMGLKESKFLVEQIEQNGHGSIDIQPDREISTIYNFNTLSVELPKSNISVSNENIAQYVEQLKEMAVAATLAGHYYVANSILTLLKDRF